MTRKEAGFAPAEEWIVAADAVRLLRPVFNSPYTAQMTICKRAHGGLIRSRAERFMMDNQTRDNFDIPKGFWWAEGHEALKQNWATGDFDTWIDNGSRHLQAFGVLFSRPDIEKMVPQKLDAPTVAPPSVAPSGHLSNDEVFIVHGQDTAAKVEVAHFIEHAGLKPIILHAQPNAGRTIIEKFEQHGGSVGFAVVLLTPDDVGGPNASSLQPRARQNVIGEMFWFAGKLGRNRVCALKKGDLEIPSDFSGVVYTDMDDRGAWKQLLLRELSAAGYKVDWAKALA